MSLKAGYKGIKKFSEQFDLTTEGTLSIHVENDPDAGGSLPISGDAAKILAERDAATRQLIDDTIGFESYNEFIPSLSGSYDKGVTLVINANKTISLSGTATMTHVLNVGKFVCKANEEYILSGCPSGGGTGSSNYWLGAYIDNDITDDRKDIGNGCTFSFNADTEITVKYRVPNGYVATGVTLYPMITKTIYKGFPYQPYHASVEESKADNTVIAPVENGSTASQAYSVGQHFIKDGAFCTVIASIASGATLTLNTNYTSGDVASLLTTETGTASLPTTPVSGLTIASNRNNIKRNGYNVYVDVGISLANEVTLTAGTALIKLPYVSNTFASFGLIENTTNKFISDILCYTATNGQNISAMAYTLPAGGYTLVGSYLCK